MMYFKQIDRSYLDDVTAATNGKGYYWLYVSNKDAISNGVSSGGIPFTSYSHAFSARIHWNMVCGPQSTAVTELTYAGTYTNWQFAQISDLNLT